MGGGGGSDSTSTSITEVPKQFEPYYAALFESAQQAAAKAAGNNQNYASFGQYMGNSPYANNGMFSNYAPQGQQGQQGQQGSPGGQFSNGAGKGGQGIPASAIQSLQNGQSQFNQGGGKSPGSAPGQGLEGGQYMQGNPKSTRPMFDDHSGSQPGQPGSQPGQYNPGGWGLPDTGYGSPAGQYQTGYGSSALVGSPYAGQFLAPSTPQELASLQQREGLAQQFQGIGNPIMQLGQDQAAGKYLNSNPYFNQALMNAMNPAIQEFTGNVMPQFNSQAINQGAFKGSSARDFATASLGGAFGRDLLNTAGAMGFQNYANERQIQQGSGELIDQGARLNQLSPEILQQAGLGYRDVYQRYLDENLLQFQESQQAPFRSLMPLASIIHGGDIGSQTTNFGQQPSAFGGGITGALSGAGLGATAGQQMGGGTGALYGGGLGALAGGLAGALG